MWVYCRFCGDPVMHLALRFKDKEEYELAYPKIKEWQNKGVCPRCKACLFWRIEDGSYIFGHYFYL